jgi:hypothetical protein
MLTPRVKKVLMALVVIFVIYAVLSSPDDSAGVVREAVSKLGSGLESVGQFFDSLMQG